MKPIYNNTIPPKGYKAINLFGLFFIRNEYKDVFEKYPETLLHILRHESIHTAQIKEMIYVLFYLFYVVEWFIRLIQYRDRDKAYQNISFEREAYANDHDKEYLNNRKPFSFLKYI